MYLLLCTQQGILQLLLLMHLVSLTMLKKKKSIIRRSAAKNTFGCLKQESFVSG